MAIVVCFWNCEIFIALTKGEGGYSSHSRSDVSSSHCSGGYDAVPFFPFMNSCFNFLHCDFGLLSRGSQRTLAPVNIYFPKILSHLHSLQLHLVTPLWILYFQVSHSQLDFLKAVVQYFHDQPHSPHSVYFLELLHSVEIYTYLSRG